MPPKKLKKEDQSKNKRKETLQKPERKVDTKSDPTLSKAGLEEEKQAKNDDQKDALLKKSIKTTGETAPTPPTILAWCSQLENKISLIDLETKENYATFDGPKISDGTRPGAHVKEIPNTKFLISLYHSWEKVANLEIFDISQKMKANKIYSLGEVSGVCGQGDLTYNARRNILGAVSVKQKIAYHLFTVDPNASNTKDIVKLTRKSKWPSQLSKKEDKKSRSSIFVDDFISSFDFNPAGESIANLNSNGACAVSDVNTDSSGFQMKVGEEGKTDNFGRCRWSTNTGEPLIFVKNDSNMLNVLDVEKQALTLKKPAQLERKGEITRWIDVCPTDGNLVASGGHDFILKIFDRRQAKIVKKFQGLHKHYIHCVRWSSNGDMIATASYDCDFTVNLLDFKTEKDIHSVTTANRNYAYSVCLI